MKITYSFVRFQGMGGVYPAKKKAPISFGDNSAELLRFIKSVREPISLPISSTPWTHTWEKLKCWFNSLLLAFLQIQWTYQSRYSVLLFLFILHFQLFYLLFELRAGHARAAERITQHQFRHGWRDGWDRWREGCRDGWTVGVSY